MKTYFTGTEGHQGSRARRPDAVGRSAALGEKGEEVAKRVQREADDVVAISSLIKRECVSYVSVDSRTGHGDKTRACRES